MRRAAAALALAASLTLTGCLEQDLDHDYYSEVAEACAQPPPTGSPLAHVDDLRRTWPTPECRQALEEIIPYEKGSFEDADPGVLDKVTEAFWALLAFPLSLDPHGRILGENAGSNPHLCVLAPFLDPDSCFYEGKPSRNLAQNAFNYVLNRVDWVRYGGANGTMRATYTPRSLRASVGITIHDNFWRPEFVFEAVRGPIARASTLIHEARHGDGYMHVPCDGPDGGDCDPDLSGPYGLQAIYLQAALRASYSSLTTLDLAVLAGTYLDPLEKRINKLPAALKQLVERNRGKWVLRDLLEREGLPPLASLSQALAPEAPRAQPLHCRQSP